MKKKQEKTTTETRVAYASVQADVYTKKMLQALAKASDGRFIVRYV